MLCPGADFDIHASSFTNCWEDCITDLLLACPVTAINAHGVAVYCKVLFIFIIPQSLVEHHVLFSRLWVFFATLSSVSNIKRARERLCLFQKGCRLSDVFQAPNSIIIRCMKDPTS